MTQGELDPNWTVTLPDGTAFGSAISATDPNGGWVAPTPPNTWISVVGRGSVPPGVYQYTTQFLLGPGTDLSAAGITGEWWSDEPQPGNGILLNGLLVSEFDGAIWNDANVANAAFSIGTGFVEGVNTLTFLVENTGGPGGILVQNLVGSAPVIPESSTIVTGLVVLGLGVGGRLIAKTRRG